MYIYIYMYVCSSTAVSPRILLPETGSEGWNSKIILDLSPIPNTPNPMPERKAQEQYIPSPVVIVDGTFVCLTPLHYEMFFYLPPTLGVPRMSKPKEDYSFTNPVSYGDCSECWILILACSMICRASKSGPCPYGPITPVI